MNLTLTSLDGICRIAKLTGYAAEFLRTLSNRRSDLSYEFCILLFLIHMFEETCFFKVTPLKLFYYQTFFETWRNEHS